MTAPSSWAACVECGNDDPTEGSPYCLDCLERIDALRLAWADGYAAGRDDEGDALPIRPNPYAESA